MLETKNISWELVTSSEMFQKSGIGSEMGLTSDSIIEFKLQWNNGSSNTVFYDVQTDEFAFMPSSDSRADGLLYDFGAIVSNFRNSFRTPELFFKHVGALIDDEVFFISEV